MPLANPDSQEKMRTEERPMNPKIQKEFKPAIEECFACCRNRFGEKLLSCYVAGSVGSGEAWAGYSDVDWWAFVEDESGAPDTLWRRDCESDLSVKYPFIKDFHLNCHPVTTLKKETFWRFILKYNSLLYWGTDVISDLEKVGISTPVPSPEIVKTRLWWVRDCVKGLNEGVFPDSLFADAIPSKLDEMEETNFQASRKLARNFILTEGAYLLMASGHFSSFRTSDILPRLALVFPQWCKLFEMSERILNDPVEAGISPRRLVQEIKPYVNWMIRETDQG